jgi:hypothetical protein
MTLIESRRRRTAHGVVAATIASALAFNGCAARGEFLRQRAVAQSGETTSQPPSETYVRYIRSLPVGSRVKVALHRGARLDAVLVAADDAGVIVKPRTRIPEPERGIPMSEIASIELHASEGMGVGKAILIGVAAGGGAIPTILFITLATGWD